MVNGLVTGKYGMVLESWTLCCMFAVCTVLGLEDGKECIIVGTLYKHMKLKPSILDEYSKEVSYCLSMCLSFNHLSTL